jgi:hypothetical protein
VSRRDHEIELLKAQKEAVEFQELYYHTLNDLRNAHRGNERLSWQVRNLKQELALTKIAKNISQYLERSNGNGKDHEPERVQEAS